MIEPTDNSNNLLTLYDKNLLLYQTFESEIEHQIKRILQTNEITYNAITSRLKSRESLAEKIDRKQGKYTHISDVTDIVGVRIITYYSEDVDKIAEIIEREFDVDTENSIDKRKSLEPDRFGYCSVHYVVKMSSNRLSLPEYKAFDGLKCEIQIRSVLQHAWAEIEHDIGYKSEITVPKEMRRSFSRIAGLLEIADKEFDQIRHALIEYKNSAETQIEDKDFLERELDAVILQVMLESNEKVININTHISKLLKRSLDEVTNDDFKPTIHKLNYLGITTVGQLNDALKKYSSAAMNIASKYLTSSSGIRKPTIAFFYLCYAVLLSTADTKEEIFKYLEETNIGFDFTARDRAAKKLLDIRNEVFAQNK